LAIHAFGGLTWWLIGASLMLAGFLYVFGAGVALWVNPRGPLARSFAWMAGTIGLMMVCLLDFHLSYRLVLVFDVALAITPGTFCILALRLPDDAPVLRRNPWLERAVLAVGCLVAAWYVLADLLGWSRREADVWRSFFFGAAVIFALITFCVRYALATGYRRDILRAFLVVNVLPWSVIGLTMAAEPLFGRWWRADVVAYGAIWLGPLGVAYAFVRYDLWGSGALLSRVFTRVAIGGLACVAAICLAVALASFVGVAFRAAVLAATASGVLSALLVVAALHIADIWVFPSHAGYKPSVEQLSSELISITSPGEVERAIEGTVRRWLPCDQVRVASENNNEATSTRSAEMAPSAAEMVFPLIFGGQRQGTLEVGPKRGGALFTSDDLDLLGTVANQGALALAHARAYQELEHRRQEQAAAWRGEREALVETVASEISHEVRYPLNFFRNLFGRAGRNQLSSEDIQIGREEVERLERLVGGLRRMAGRRIERSAVAIRTLCARAELLLRDSAQGRRLQFDGDPELEIRCDTDQATQVLVNLLANALQATDQTGRVGATWEYHGRDVTISVWDDGAGFTGDPAMLFAPWYTTKERGTGLGLSITQRLVRAHGWTIDARREVNRTLFVVTVPSSDVVQSKKSRERKSKLIA
jgi:signal transduction histidine kinase